MANLPEHEKRRILEYVNTQSPEKRLGQLTDFLVEFEHEPVVVAVDAELFGVQARNGLQVVLQQSQIPQVTLSLATHDGRRNR